VNLLDFPSGCQWDTLHLYWTSGRHWELSLSRIPRR